MDALLRQIEAIISKLLAEEPLYTGSLGFEIHFKDGEPRDIIKQVERTRIKIGGKSAYR